MIFTARQEEATVKRIKLEYDEISPCAKEGAQIWDLLLTRSKGDSQMIFQTLKQGNLTLLRLSFKIYI
jgi:TBC1 domain-containing protein 4